MEKAKAICYVIMPIGDTATHDAGYWSRHFENILKPLIERDAGLEARKSTPMRGDLLSGIVSNLILSRVLVAELTDKNPNVFWELGVRHGFKHGTVLVAEEGTDLPFDIRSIGVHFYKHDLQDYERFRGEFVAALRDCLENPERPDSPVLAAGFGKGSLSWRLQREEIVRKLDGLLLELDGHASMLKNIWKTNSDNLEKKRRKEFSALNVRIACTELLVASRYVEGQEHLYKFADAYYETMDALGRMVLVWPNDPQGFEEWFGDTYKNIVKNHDAFKAMVSSVRKNVADEM